MSRDAYFNLLVKSVRVLSENSALCNAAYLWMIAETISNAYDGVLMQSLVF